MSVNETQNKCLAFLFFSFFFSFFWGGGRGGLGGGGRGGGEGAGFLLLCCVILHTPDNDEQSTNKKENIWNNTHQCNCCLNYVTAIYMQIGLAAIIMISPDSCSVQVLRQV